MEAMFQQEYYNTVAKATIPAYWYVEDHNGQRIGFGDTAEEAIYDAKRELRKRGI